MTSRSLVFMKLIEAKDYHEMSKLAAEIILKQVKEKED
ncbi:hypothetical protein (plasmid) [Metabacillus dongyingensis]|nr:hypothetical protein [Metabacillus dongyingensis]